MKKIAILLFVIFALLLVFTYDKDTQEYQTDTAETPQKTYLDTPMNTYKERIEVQNIANTIQTSGSNLNSHINARVDSKQAVETANSKMDANDKALDAFMK